MNFNRLRVPVLLTLIVSMAVVASAPSASGSALITTKGHNKIVRINPATGNDTTIFKLKRGVIATLAGASQANRIAFVTRKRKYVFSGIARVTEQIWVMRKNGSRLREVKRFVRKVRGRSSVISPPEDNRGARCTINAIDISNDGKKIAIVRLFSLHEFKVGKGRLKYLNKDNGLVFDPEYDPTGKKIVAFFDGPRNSGVGVMNLRGDYPHLLWDHRVDVFQGQPSFSPDGRRIVFGAEKERGKDPHPRAVSSTGIWVMDRNGERARILPATRRSKLDFNAPTFSPDGKSLAFVSSRYDKDSGYDTGYVFTTDLRGRQTRVVFRDERGGGFLQRPLAWIP